MKYLVPGAVGTRGSDTITIASVTDHFVEYVDPFGYHYVMSNADFSNSAFSGFFPTGATSSVASKFKIGARFSDDGGDNTIATITSIDGPWIETETPGGQQVSSLAISALPIF